MRFWIIDGYNVLFGIGDLRRLTLKKASRGREELISRVAEMCSRRNEQGIIIFDGGGRPDFHFDRRIGPVRVYFSGSQHEADDWIMKIAGKLFAKYPELTVVSSDGRIRGFVGQQGIWNMGLRKFGEEYLAKD